MKNKHSPVICVMGPTASGKTALAFEIVKHFDCEIISVDSAMIYRGMDIGTAKPDKTLLNQVPHHLVDIRDPSERYSAGQFYEDATLAINDIISRDKIPLLVGGTMLYFKVLREGIAEMPKANPIVRENLQKRKMEYGLFALYQELILVDPIAAKRINPHDAQRIQRALEVYETSGKTLTAWQLEHHQDGIANPANHQWLNIALAPQTREQLHTRIALRFDQMIAQGWLDEVKRLYDRGDLSVELPAIRAVGYRQFWSYFSGELTYQQALEKAHTATRQFAKRQMTWLRSWPELSWFDSEDSSHSEKVLSWLSNILS